MSYYTVFDYVPNPMIYCNLFLIESWGYTVKKVELNMNAQEKYEIIQEAARSGNKLRASLKIGCTLRHVNRLLKKYHQDGKAAFLHGNTGRQPAHTLPASQKTAIIALYNNKYWDTQETLHGYYNVLHQVLQTMVHCYLQHILISIYLSATEYS